MKIFVDTSAFIAIVNPKDSHHTEAITRRKCIKEEKIQCYTSNLVLYETLTWLAIKLGPDAAVQLGEGILQESPHLNMLYLDREDELASLKVLKKYHQIPLSFADASSLHFIHKYQLDQVFGFDEHFTKVNLILF